MTYVISNPIGPFRPWLRLHMPILGQIKACLMDISGFFLFPVGGAMTDFI